MRESMAALLTIPGVHPPGVPNEPDATYRSFLEALATQASAGDAETTRKASQRRKKHRRR